MNPPTTRSGMRSIHQETAALVAGRFFSSTATPALGNSLIDTAFAGKHLSERLAARGAVAGLHRSGRGGHRGGPLAAARAPPSCAPPGPGPERTPTLQMSRRLTHCDSKPTPEPSVLDAGTESRAGRSALASERVLPE